MYRAVHKRLHGRGLCAPLRSAVSSSPVSGLVCVYSCVPTMTAAASAATMLCTSASRSAGSPGRGWCSSFVRRPVRSLSDSPWKTYRGAWKWRQRPRLGPAVQRLVERVEGGRGALQHLRRRSQGWANPRADVNIRTEICSQTAGLAHDLWASPADFKAPPPARSPGSAAGCT